MPRYTVKLTDNDKEYYLMWSSIVDAPVTCGMKYEEYVEWYKERYGVIALQEWKDGKRNFLTEDIILEYNRAGENETQLNKEGLLNIYCRE